MILQVGTKILLKNNQGKYLLLKRSIIKYPEVEGRWDIVGGRIEVGTPLLENLKREIKEETGLELIKEPKLITAQDILRGTDKHVVRLTYLGEIEGTPTLDPNEHEEYKWLTLPEINQQEDLDYYFKQIIPLVNNSNDC